MSEYSISIEKFEDIREELLPLATLHYEEMSKGFRVIGVELPEYNPDFDEHERNSKVGNLLMYTLRYDNELVGYFGVYFSKSLDTQLPIAYDGGVYVRKDHRNGIGTDMVSFVLADLSNRDIISFELVSRTDPRFTEKFEKMGFKAVATQMLYTF